VSWIDKDGYIHSAHEPQNLPLGSYQGKKYFDYAACIECEGSTQYCRGLFPDAKAAPSYSTKDRANLPTQKSSPFDKFEKILEHIPAPSDQDILAETNSEWYRKRAERANYEERLKYAYQGKL